MSAPDDKRSTIPAPTPALAAAPDSAAHPDIAPGTTVRPASPSSSASTSLDETRLSGERLGEVLSRGTAVGRYFVLQMLGEGGMGTVYAAYDPDLGRKVAIKLLKVSSEGAEEARIRLLREAQAMARLSHPNVLPVFDAGLFGDQLFVAMEYVPGATLADWLRQHPRPFPEILSAFVDAGQGLAAAHAAGLVHRDFKPENVLVGRDGRVRVMDFGLAHVEATEETSAVGRPRLSDSARGANSTLSGQIAGTPAYMAPEQFAGAATDERTDQFAFCVALWEALCGERPFAGLDFGTIRHSVLLGSPRPPPRAAKLDGTVRTALLKGLSRTAADRFASMSDLLSVLVRRQNRGRVLRRVAGWVAAALVLFTAAGLTAWRSHQEATRCEREAEAATRSTWDPARRSAVAANLSAAGLAQDAVSSVLGQLDAAFAAWSHSRKEACEQARSASQPDAQPLWCLERLRLRAHSVVGLLGRPAPELAGSVAPLLDSLDVAEVCLRRSSLSQVQRPPRS
ncbi:MAG: serine/threonine-protein kinase [Myxococcales bacterium]